MNGGQESDVREPGATRPARILLLGGTSEIGLAILAALRAPQNSQVLLAGRDEARLTAAGKELQFEVPAASTRSRSTPTRG